MRWRRMPDATVADLLGRLAIATSAGIDMRRAWAGEAVRASARWKPVIEQVARSLAAGTTLAESVDAVGTTFSPVVRGMLAAGELAGREPDVCRDLAAQCRRSARNAAELRRSLVGPAVKALVAVGVVTLLILVAGSSFDMLGIGLTGQGGAVTFLVIVAGVVACGWALVVAALRSWRHRGIVRHALARIPLIGRAAADAERAAWCRAASLASGIGLDIRQLLTIASAVAPGLAIDPGSAAARLRDGLSLAEMLRETRLFPRPLLEAVGVGELTGTTAEALDRLAEAYDEDAARGFKAAAGAAGAAAWLAVAGLVVLLVFRLFTAYAGILQDAARGL
ncbi:MAG: type II secretion system F family protein [Planctomycetia bacterium]